jgi:hypothetical protein
MNGTTMTNRTVSIIILFLAATASAGVALALTVFWLTRQAMPTGPWLAPVVIFVSFVGVFFLARRTVLPAAVADPPLAALLALSAWIGATLLVALAVAWVLEPLTMAFGIRQAALIIMLASLLASVGLFERGALRRRWRWRQG